MSMLPTVAGGEGKGSLHNYEEVAGRKAEDVAG